MLTPTAKQLSEYAFFSDMSPAFIEFIAKHATEKRFGREQLLFRHGEPAATFYLILSGRVSLEIPAISGPTLVVQELGPDQVLGWSWLIAPYKWDFNARAIEDTSVLEFDGQSILTYCGENHEFGYQVLKRFSGLMSERLDAARTRMMEEWNPPGFA
ncbi:regulator [Alkalilimnicola ehrlichii]|uniref:Regulator n=1 Tax=Alkalilimnicola ehrlichii TaxID=351052 RepID=A0A3E0WT37_9GAMM|nr:cyclic nucleotide-binding domain-containing protein [Alkalilimnicola ehrlichii]RFA29221.1 regulator [Alkalilimnicola ehrlichii]RFA36134.1 regulator [Alkalilimnicola ehrlichii]